MNIKKLILCSICIIHILLPQSGFSAPDVVTLSSNKKEYHLGYNISYLNDATGKLTLSNVTSNQYSDSFRNNNNKYVALKSTPGAYWFKIKINDKTSSKVNWILELDYHFYDEIEVYILCPDKKYTLIRSGNYVHASKRQISHRSYAFKVTFEKNKINYVYLRIKKRGRMILPLFLWSSDMFIRRVGTDYLYLGTYYGLVLVMLLLFLFIFVALREKIYLFYVFYLFSFALWYFAFDGLGYLYLWQESPEFNLLSPFLFSSLLLFWMLVFIRSFLKIKRYSKLLNKILYCFIIFAALDFLFFITGFFNTILVSLANILNLATIVIVYIAGVISYKRGLKSARYILIGWSIFSLGMISFNLVTLNILIYNDLTKNLLRFGSMIEVVLFSVALADRVYIERKDKVDAQSKAIESMKKADEAKNMYLEKLETEVEERTNELRKTMQDMELMNNNLASLNSELIQAQLIAQKDMFMAANVQGNFLPGQAPVSGIWDVAFYFKPMNGVSGDFYDFYEVDDQFMGLGIFDVSGHGISSGLVTMIAKSIIARHFLHGSDLPVHRILEEANVSLISELKDVENYLTGIMIRFEDSNTISYTNASHPDALVKSAGIVTHVLGDDGKSISGTLLGAFEKGVSYSELRKELRSGDTLLLFTDCLYEDKDEDDEPYGMHRIQQSFVNAPEGTAQEIVRSLVSDFENFVADKNELNDDLTILVVRRV